MAKQFRVKQTGKQPIPFELVFDQFKRDEAGQVVYEGDEPVTIEVTEKFTARGSIPGVLMMKIAGASNPADQVARLVEFFVKVLVPEDRDRWMETLEESDPPISMEQIGEIAEWLIEEYGEVPTT